MNSILIQANCHTEEIWAIFGNHPAIFDVIENKNGRRDWRTIIEVDPMHIDLVVDELENQYIEWKEY